MRFARAAIVLAAALPLAAAAQIRTIPEDAERGQLRHVQEMEVSLDGKVERLAPGAQIRNADNRVVLPVTLTSDTTVKYRRNGEGRLFEVWILTPAEAAKGEAKK
jgi:hypothetical protein